MRFYAFLCILFALLIPVACDDGGTAAAPSPDAGTPNNPPSRPIDSPAPTDDDDDTAAKPTIAKLTPASASVGSVGPTVVVTGTGFVPRSTVRVDGTDVETSFQSATELAATIPDAKLAAVGKLKVTVKTSSPGGGESDPVEFAVENPPPEIIAIAPFSVPAGSNDTKVTITGTTLTKTSTVQFGTKALPTTFIDAEHLEATIAKADLVDYKSVPITVVTAAPGGGTSQKIAFVVSTGVFDSFTPTTVAVNAPPFDLVVTGTGFVSGSKISFNDTELDTTLVSGTQLKATVTTDLVATAGDKTIAVKNPPPGGILAAPPMMTFTVENPVPALDSLSQTSAMVGTPAFALTAIGSNFVAGSQIYFEAAGLASPTVVDTMHLTGQVGLAQLNAVKKFKVTVKTAPPCAGQNASPCPSTNSIDFSVQPALPKVTKIDPAAVAVGTSDPVTFTITGTGFITGKSTISIDGQMRPTKTITATAITFELPPSAFGTLGTTYSVVVTTPPDLGGGGGSAAPVKITVGCDVSGVNTKLDDSLVEQPFDIHFENATRLTRWQGESNCPGTLAAPVVTKQPGKYNLVVNNTAHDLKLTTWAVCDAKGAAFLTLYSRGNYPADDSQRLQCTGVVAKGEPHLSPEANGSVNCPGLTKENGGALLLHACERAVVHIQAFDETSATFSTPAQIKIKAEQP